jgi:hypothetical protein
MVAVKVCKIGWLDRRSAEADGLQSTGGIALQRHVQGQ